MFELKSLSSGGIASALQKAERYRLLNDPAEAESICLDILQIEPENQQAFVALLLALTDQFRSGEAEAVNQARDILPRLQSEYEQAYYAGIICERRAKAQLSHGQPGSGFYAYDWFREAMDCYEKAIVLRPPGNDSAILRWNACARFLMRHPHLKPREEERFEPFLE